MPRPRTLSWKVGVVDPRRRRRTAPFNPRMSHAGGMARSSVGRLRRPALDVGVEAAEHAERQQEDRHAVAED
eukprot:11271599-Alexandrium_andersonii.AAC.1